MAPLVVFAFLALCGLRGAVASSSAPLQPQQVTGLPATQTLQPGGLQPGNGNGHPSSVPDPTGKSPPRPITDHPSPTLLRQWETDELFAGVLHKQTLHEKFDSTGEPKAEYLAEDMRRSHLDAQGIPSHETTIDDAEHEKEVLEGNASGNTQLQKEEKKAEKVIAGALAGALTGQKTAVRLAEEASLLNRLAQKDNARKERQVLQNRQTLDQQNARNGHTAKQDGGNEPNAEQIEERLEHDASVRSGTSSDAGADATERVRVGLTGPPTEQPTTVEEEELAARTRARSRDAITSGEGTVSGLPNASPEAIAALQDSPSSSQTEGTTGSGSTQRTTSSTTAADDNSANANGSDGSGENDGSPLGAAAPSGGAGAPKPMCPDSKPKGEVDILELQALIKEHLPSSSAGFRADSQRWFPVENSNKPGHFLIGWGHRCTEEQHALWDREGITQAQADEMFGADVQKALDETDRVLSGSFVRAKARVAWAAIFFETGDPAGTPDLRPAIEATKLCDYGRAALDLKDTLFAQQHSRTKAKAISGMLNKIVP